eukprot:3521337-Pleurochrysis_carterae.AAC.2
MAGRAAREARTGQECLESLTLAPPAPKPQQAEGLAYNLMAASALRFINSRAAQQTFGNLSCQRRRRALSHALRRFSAGLHR